MENKIDKGLLSKQLEKMKESSPSNFKTVGEALKTEEFENFISSGDYLGCYYYLYKKST